MRKFVKALALFSAILTFGIACDDDSQKPPEVNTWIFPNEVGDWWVYQVADSLSSAIDTIRVRIEGRDTLNNGDSVTVWVFSDGDEIDTSYLHIGYGFLTTDSGPVIRYDTVFIYAGKDLTSLSDIMIFPLRVGDFWMGVMDRDTVRVVEKMRIQTRAGDFDAYLVQTTRNQFENVINSKKWVVHHLGMARWDFVWLSGTMQGHEGWELLNWLPEGAFSTR
ncbi:MAG: hypothetical protein AB1690_05375 [Candidatus Zixiibacteriota bacterium]|jgi:hypothetical protein